MKIILSFIALLILSACIHTEGSKETKEKEIPKSWLDFAGQRTTVQCADYDENQIEYILELELAIVRVQAGDMIDLLQKFHDKNNSITEDASLIKLLQETTKDITSSSINRGLANRAEFQIQHLLKGKKAKVFNKKMNRYESTIDFAYFSYSVDPLFAGGGWIYVFSKTDTVFFEVLEWMS